jgi:peroxiredoxin
MGSRNRILEIVAALIVLVGVVILVTAWAVRRNAALQTGGQEAPIAAGAKAADFTLEALDGTTVSLDRLRGKVVFLNLWATWCGPCREEMPSMETLFDEFRNRKDFVMLAVSQDTKGRQVVEPYVQKNSYHFKILLDPQNKVGEAYDVSGVPETFIIDRKGRIVAHHLGAFDWSRPDVKEALEELLDSKEVSTH